MGGDKPKGAWGGPKRDFEAGVLAGTESAASFPERPEESPDVPHSIDPGLPIPGKPNLKERFPILAPILDKLEEIEQREFWNKNPTAFVEKDLEQLSELVKILKEAMLFRAVTENWTQEILTDQFEMKMKDLYTRAASRPKFHELLGQMRRAWHWFALPENLGLEGKNKYLENRTIKVEERPRIAMKLIALETEVKKDELGDAEDIEEKIDDEELNEDQLEFVEEELIPMYRMYVIDNAILENASKTCTNKLNIPDFIYEDYKKILRSRYRSALK